MALAFDEFGRPFIIIREQEQKCIPHNTCVLSDVKNNPRLLEKLLSVLQDDGEDLDCPICISPPTNIVITCCAHIFCQSCILETLKRTKPCCPMCRHPLAESDLFKAPPESSQEALISF